MLLAALVLGMSAVSGSGNVASAAPSASDWQRLRECESGNNYSINTGNGYYGAYQFDLSTWRSVGGTGYPHQASPATQDALALALWQQRGWSPWVCARILGLGNNPDPDPPVGAVDPVVHNGLTASVSGWAFDASNYGQSIQVHVNVNGNRNVFTADQPRPELAQYGIPGIHGFRVSVPLERGRNNEICVWAIGIAANNVTQVSCTTVGPASSPPVGAVDPIVHNGLTASVSGWAFDADNYGQSIQVHVNVNGNRNVFTANQPRPELAQYGIPGIHGFQVSVPLDRGRNNEICVWAIGIASGNVSQVSCSTVGPADAAPVGAVDPVVHNGMTAAVTGWAFDADNYGQSIQVHVNVNGVRNVFTANQPRPELAQYGIPGIHGFQVSVPLERGRNNEICVWAIGIASGNVSQVSCSTVGPADAPPVGNVESITATGLKARVVGWTFDPKSASTSTRVHVYVNGVGRSFVAGSPRNDVNQAYSIGGAHGFDVEVPLSAGDNRVCVYGIGVATGNNKLLACRTVPGTAAAARVAAAPPEVATLGAPAGTLMETLTAAATPTSPPLSPSAPATDPSTASVPATTESPAPTPTTSAPSTSSMPSPAPASPSSSTTTGAAPSTVVTTPTAAPASKGAFDALVLSGTTGTLTGWIADPTADAEGRWVRITINGVTHDVFAGTARADATDTGGVAALGFDDPVTLATGANEVCLYEIDGGGGISTAPVVCRTEVVS